SNGVKETLQFDAVFGTDGSHSVVRTALQKRRGFNFMQEYAEQAASELRLPPGSPWDAARHAEHFIIGQKSAMVGFPNPDGGFTLAWLLPLDGPDSAPALVASGRGAAVFA